MLSDKSVLITGAGGFIGLHAVKMFAQNPHFDVYALVHKNIPEELENINNIKILKADIRDKNSFMSACGDFRPDIIIHAAGIASDVISDEEALEVNFEPVKYLSEFALEKFIFISSTDVYGIKDFFGENENELCFDKNPKNPYPKYKIKAEKWLASNLDKSKYVILRPGAVYGENDKTLEHRIKTFLKYSPYIIHFGKWKGKNRWPAVNVLTVAKAALYCACLECCNGEAVNLTDENIMTIDDYYRKTASKYFPDKKFKTLFLPLWCGKLAGYISVKLTQILKLKKPLFDPTSYSLLHVSSNLDFGREKLDALFSENILSSWYN